MHFIRRKESIDIVNHKTNSISQMKLSDLDGNTFEIFSGDLKICTAEQYSLPNIHIPININEIPSFSCELNNVTYSDEFKKSLQSPQIDNYDIRLEGTCKELVQKRIHKKKRINKKWLKKYGLKEVTKQINLKLNQCQANPVDQTFEFTCDLM